MSFVIKINIEKLLHDEESFSFSVVEENKSEVKKRDDDYDTLSDIDFQDGVQVTKGRLKIYQKILSAEQEYEETKKRLTILKQNCQSAHEELDRYNSEVLSQSKSQSFAFVTFPSSQSELKQDSQSKIIPETNSASVEPITQSGQELLCKECLNYYNTGSCCWRELPRPVETHPAVLIIPQTIPQSVKISQPKANLLAKQQSKASPVAAKQQDPAWFHHLIPALDSKKLTQSKPKGKDVPQVAQSAPSHTPKIQRKPFGEVMNVGDKLYFKKTDLSGTWNGSALLYEGNEYLSLSKLMIAHKTTLGITAAMNSWTSYKLQRKGTQKLEDLTIFEI